MTTESSNLEVIRGREGGETNSRVPLYHVRVPLNWVRVEPETHESLLDTTKSICEFYVEEGAQRIRIAIHNFPSQTAEERIPPMAQIARWKRQFETLDLTIQSIVPQSFSGYAGYLYEGKGTVRGQDTTMLGWVLQIGAEHYRMLSRPKFPMEMRSDITIKALGPSTLMVKYRKKIIAFARSFELIEEIPKG